MKLFYREPILKLDHTNYTFFLHFYDTKCHRFSRLRSREGVLLRCHHDLV